MKGKTCCVTGHRDLPQKEINHVIISLMVTFFSFMADASFGIVREIPADTIISKCLYGHHKIIPNFSAFHIWILFDSLDRHKKLSRIFL